MTNVHTRILDFFTLHQKRATWILAGVCGVALLSAVGGLVWALAGSGKAPDAKTGDLNQIAEFVKSDRFLNLDSRQRGQYVGTLEERYLGMSDEEKEKAHQTFGNLLRKNRTAQKTVMLSLVTGHANRYSKLSPEEKRRYLDNLIAMQELMRGRAQTQNDYRNKNPMQRKPLTQEQQMRAIQRARKNIPLVLNKTTAVDRARMAQMARDMLQRMRERYEGGTTP